MKKKFTLSRSLFWIFSSAVLFNAVAYGGIKGYQYWKKVRSLDYKVSIRAIVQTGPLKEALKTAYLTELLDLSVDRPTMSCQFDLKQAQAKLLSSPVIKHAEVKMKEPGILYIDYTTRQPICFLSDFGNVALDQDGCPFPVTPFFTPKKLPEIYLGLKKEIEWNQPITGQEMALAFELLHFLNGPIVSDLFNVKKIDVSNAFARNYGRQEIVLHTQDEIYSSHQGQEICFVLPRLLRLSTKKYSQELSNYLKLREELLEKEKLTFHFPEDDQLVVRHPLKIIDFRIPQLAFIEEGK